MEEPGFWDDPDKSNKQMKELKTLKDTVGIFKKLADQYGFLRIPTGTAVQIARAKFPIKFQKISDEELAQRMANFVPKKKPLSGYLKRYAALVSSGAKGAILNYD